MVQHGHHRDQVSLTVTGRCAELLEAAPADGHPRVIIQARARGGCHARIGVYPGDACEVPGQLPGEHTRPAADIHGDPAAGWQITQDPAVEVLIVIPRVTRVDPGQPAPGTGQHRIRAGPDIHARQSPKGHRDPPQASFSTHHALWLPADGRPQTSRSRRARSECQAAEFLIDSALTWLTCGRTFPAPQKCRFGVVRLDGARLAATMVLICGWRRGPERVSRHVQETLAARGNRAVACEAAGDPGPGHLPYARLM